MKFIIILILSIFVIGCAYDPMEPKDPFVPASWRPDLARFVVKADEVAEEVLKEFNNSEWAKELDEGPFKLKDYRRRLMEDNDLNDNRKIVVVFYEIRKAVGFLGHPEHFSVWVYKDTGETKCFGGM
jgi:hypothetical protein